MVISPGCTVDYTSTQKNSFMMRDVATGKICHSAQPGTSFTNSAAHYTAFTASVRRGKTPGKVQNEHRNKSNEVLKPHQHTNTSSTCIRRREKTPLWSTESDALLNV